LLDDGTGFDRDKTYEGEWYKTNVLAPSGTFCMWAPQEAVELIADFADDVEMDRRYLTQERRPDGK
jgi:hypothetical protein